MIKKNLLLITLLLCVLIVNGQSKISPYTQAFLLNHSASEVTKTHNEDNNIFVKTITRNAITYVDAFIKLNQGASTSAITDKGVAIYTQAGDILTVQIPVDDIVAISELEEVRNVSVAQPLNLLNDKARTSTKVSSVHDGTGLIQPYTGKGVVFGVVDIGIDVNHVAFQDDEGKSRVKRVYFPHDNSGTRPSGVGVNGRLYSGSEYTTPEAIAKLTTDYNQHSHGSHTTGTAAGSYKKNGYYGMAPEADIVMVGTPELTDINIANGVVYSFNYANSQNQPAVVNLSLGGHMGPHDGTSTINQFFDALVADGNIIVVSSGNEGGAQLYANKTFNNETDELKTFVIDNREGSRKHNGFVDAWSKTNAKFGMKVVVYDIASSEILYESKEFKPAANGVAQINSQFDANFAKYYKGQVILFSSLSDVTGKFNILSQFATEIPNFRTSISQPTYRLGFVYTSNDNASIDIWADCDNTFLSSENVTGWTDGNASCSINEMATSNSLISVGAYSAKTSYTTINGAKMTINGAQLNKMAPFSSSGIDMNGVSRPDVVAPGYSLISPVNSYDNNTVGGFERNYLAVEESNGNRKFQWGAMGGTSMSAPVVSGIIALWLQADPTLNVEEIREIINATSVVDSYLEAEDPVRWGAGKIDALAGLASIIASGTKGVISENNAVLIYPNPSNGQFKVLAQGETSTMTLNVYAANGALVATRILDAAQGEIDVDLSSQLSTGLYIVQLIGEKVNHTSRLIIK